MEILTKQVDIDFTLQECMKLKARLSLELQAARDDRRAQQKEHLEFMSELWTTLRKIQAQFRVEAELLNLVMPQEAGEQKCQKEKSSNHCRTLDVLSKKTH
jgi:hypothetical protein